MSMSDVNFPNDLESLWMPYTANRQFKKEPRLFVEAEGMHYTTVDGRKAEIGRVQSRWRGLHS